MLTPPPGSGSREYGILRTFANEQERDAFYAMPMFKEWDDRARTLTEGEPEYRQLHGLEAWFRSPGGPPPRLRYLPASANGQLALGTYLLDSEAGVYLPLALDVLTLRGSLITDVTAFRTPEIFPRFGLPDELPPLGDRPG